MNVIFFHDHKVVISEDGFYSSGNFSEKVIARYLNFFSKFTFASRLNKSTESNNLTLMGRVGNIGYIPINNLATLSLNNYRAAYSKILKGINNHDFVIIRLPSLIGYLSFFAAKRQKKPIIIELVGCPRDSYFYYGGFKAKLMGGVQFFLNKIVLKRANNVLYVTNEFLQERYPSNASNQINCSDVEITIEDEIIEKRLTKIKTKENNIITIGLIGSLESKYKGYDLAIPAIKQLNDEGDIHYKLELVGGGNPSKVQKIANEFKSTHNVKFVGTLSHPKGIMAWLDNVDIYIQPSKTEGLSRSILEAMSRACPCVGSNVGGIPELIDAEFLHHKNSFKDLARVLKKISKKEILENQSKRNFGIAKEYQTEILDKKRSAFYKKAIENSLN